MDCPPSIHIPLHLLKCPKCLLAMMHSGKTSNTGFRVYIQLINPASCATSDVSSTFHPLNSLFFPDSASEASTAANNTSVLTTAGLSISSKVSPGWHTQLHLCRAGELLQLAHHLVERVVLRPFHQLSSVRVLEVRGLSCQQQLWRQDSCRT